MVDEAINSTLVSKYGYMIVADSSKIILSKPESVYLFPSQVVEYEEDLPPYKEDFSFVLKDNKIALYLGDTYLLSVSYDELLLMLETLNSIERGSTHGE